MKDQDIRAALRRRFAVDHAGDDDTLVVEELGLCQGAGRVDLAVINGSMAGWEIKSARDTLDRLPGQIDIYAQVLDEVTLVASERHVAHALDVLPGWWGVEVAVAVNDEVLIEPARTGARNPDVRPLAVAQLLWRDEALGLLERLGLSGGLRSKPRAVLWDALATQVPERDLRRHVREALRARDRWRTPSRPPRRAHRGRRRTG